MKSKITLIIFLGILSVHASADHEGVRLTYPGSPPVTLAEWCTASCDADYSPTYCLLKNPHEGIDYDTRAFYLDGGTNRCKALRRLCLGTVEESVKARSDYSCYDIAPQDGKIFHTVEFIPAYRTVKKNFVGPEDFDDGEAIIGGFTNQSSEEAKLVLKAAKRLGTVTQVYRNAVMVKLSKRSPSELADKLLDLVSLPYISYIEPNSKVYLDSAN